MFEQAIDAGKHILSQKPFVTDLDFGMRIVEKAERKGVRLAVNQNGRWAPHWSWIRQAIAAGILGQVVSARTAVNWNHNWIAGSVFEDVHFIVLYDFGIHWFDIASCFMRERSRFGSPRPPRWRRARRWSPPFSQALVEYEDGQASILFDANTLFGEQDSTSLSGTKGSVRSVGPDLNIQSVTLATAEGLRGRSLRGHGPGRVPRHDGRAASGGGGKQGSGEQRRGTTWRACRCASRHCQRGSLRPVAPGSVRRLPE